MIRFEAAGENEAGEKIYTLTIDGRLVREAVTIDQAVEILNRRDEERLGWDHAPRTEADDGATPHPLRGSSPGQGSQRGVEDEQGLETSHAARASSAPYKEEYPSARRTPGSSPSRGAYKERDFNGHDPV